MFLAIAQNVDRVVKIVRPRKLLYLAIDGVGPRAKINQQRSRRFRAAMDKKLKAQQQNKMDILFPKLGGDDEKKPSNHFDTNCITPGTEFMEKVATFLRSYVLKRLNQENGWNNVIKALEHSSLLTTCKKKKDPGHSLRLQHSRRRRTQNNGIHKVSENPKRIRSQHKTCHCWTCIVFCFVFFFFSNCFYFINSF